MQLLYSHIMASSDLFICLSKRVERRVVAILVVNLVSSNFFIWLFRE